MICIHIVASCLFLCYKVGGYGGLVGGYVELFGGFADADVVFILLLETLDQMMVYLSKIKL